MIIEDTKQILPEYKPTSNIGGSAHNPTRTSELLGTFVRLYGELEQYKKGKPVIVDGHNLSIAGVVAAARHSAKVVLDDSPSILENVNKSRKVIIDKVESSSSVYGLSTGFGGSADTRTDQPHLLGHALLQHQHIGILPSSINPPNVLPLLDPTSSTSMPESWVRGAMLIRMNSLIRGHSGVRWELIKKINELLDEYITPVVPLRGSISASGDLSPLSYVAGTLVGNPSIRVFHGPTIFGARQMSRSCDVLKSHNLVPLPLQPKEHLGITNGTAFSASVAALALSESINMALLSQVCTAMCTEALVGSRDSFASFIHATARPHPGQIESAQLIWDLLEGSKLAQVHQKEVSLQDDRYSLRQDRYPLRTAPQFLGPQIEDILAALTSVTQECNSTTDNPLIDGDTGIIHHGGNFQAMAVTNSMEKTRLALHHIGKIMFAQSTELVNPMMNNGLPPSLSATEPSLDYHGKGVDIATAAYVSELGYLATPVSTHIQSAEMHNQSVNSLALISARATINSLDVLSALIASYLYLLCQALDLRALQKDFLEGVHTIIKQNIDLEFNSLLSPAQQTDFTQHVVRAVRNSLDKTTTMDDVDRMAAAAESILIPIINSFATLKRQGGAVANNVDLIDMISRVQTRISSSATELIRKLRTEYLNGEHGAAPASKYLGKTKILYEFIRITLGVRMHGLENNNKFIHGLGHDEVSIGENISLIHEAIRDGGIQSVILHIFEGQ